MTKLKINRILLYFIDQKYANEWVPLCIEMQWERARRAYKFSAYKT